MDRKPKTKLKRNFKIHFVMLHINLVCYYFVPEATKDWFFMFIIFEAIMAVVTLLLSHKLGEWDSDKKDSSN